MHVTCYIVCGYVAINIKELQDVCMHVKARHILAGVCIHRCAQTWVCAFSTTTRWWTTTVISRAKYAHNTIEHKDTWVLLVCIWSRAGKSEADCVGWLRLVKWNGANGLIDMGGLGRVDSIQHAWMSPLLAAPRSAIETTWGNENIVKMFCDRDIDKPSRIDQDVVALR